MTTISRELLKRIRVDIDAALAGVAQQYGLQSLKSGSASYGNGIFSMKLDGVVEGALDKDAQRYEASAAMLGLPPLGTRLQGPKAAFIITGINTTGSKVIATMNGARYLIPTATVKLMKVAA